MAYKSIWSILVVLFPALSPGQNASFYVRGNVGISSTYETVKPQNDFFSDDYKPIFSYSGSLGIRLRAQRKLRLALEPGIMFQGRRSKSRFSSSGIYKRLNLTSAELPVLAEYAFSPKWYGCIGPVAGFLFRTYEIYPGSKENRTTYYNGMYLSGKVGMNYVLGNRIDIGLIYGQNIVPRRSGYIMSQQTGFIRRYNYHLHFTVRIGIF
jgi:hypothetical protein